MFFFQMKAIYNILNKHCNNCVKLPWEHLIGFEGVKLLLLKYVATATVTTITITNVTVWFFEFCHNSIFWVLSQFNLLIFVTIWFFEFCHNFFCWVLSHFKFFLVFVTICVFKFFFFNFFCHNLSFWVLSQFELLSFVKTCVFEFYHIMSFVYFSHNLIF